jgi:glycosyltransferase involved in cell wall biosynthesis
LIEDATFALLYNYYAQYKNLLQRSVYESDVLERLALKKASLALYPSEWGASSAREHYQAGEEKVQMVPFGGNIDAPPPIELVQRKKKSDRCKLFFLGVEWERKGGEIAFETLLKLEEKGIQAELIVCGCIPPTAFSHQRMRVIPFLSKKDEKQRAELNALFETSDFLFLPTRGDTYGMVFCEASAYGLPVIATNTGGVSGAVRDGENGFLLPLFARGAEYAELIAEIYLDDERYAELVKSSRVAYDNRLNWDAWGIAVTKLIHTMLEKKKSAPSFVVSPETVSSL